MFTKAFVHQNVSYRADDDTDYWAYQSTAYLNYFHIHYIKTKLVLSLQQNFRNKARKKNRIVFIIQKIFFMKEKTANTLKMNLC